MTDKPLPAARAERMRQALRANLARRKREVPPIAADGDAKMVDSGLERRDDRLAPRIGPDGHATAREKNPRTGARTDD
jgi:hypothetical protein